MAFEGEVKTIPIKGIARAGADSLVEDGLMNEVIGLEYKDGSFVPYSGNTLNAGVPNWAKSIHLHKTSTQTNIIVRTDSELLWMPEEVFYTTEDIGDYGEWNTLYSGPVKDVEFIKNIICISTPEKLLYLLFKEGKYGDWTVNKDSLPSVSFRVDIGIAGVENALGINKSLYYSDYPEGGIEGLLTSNLAAARGRVREEGGLTGYFLVCAAYRLKTGEYVKASNPVLMCRPMHKEGDKFYNEKTGNNTFTLKTDTLDKSIDISPSIGDEGVVFVLSGDDESMSPEKFSYIKKSVPDNNSGTSMYGCYLRAMINNEMYSQAFAEDDYMFYPPMGSSEYKKFHTSPKTIEAFYTASVPSNRLQYTINSNITIDDSLIDSLCVFISKEIDPYLDFTYESGLKDVYKETMVSITGGNEHWKSLHAIFKAEDDINEEVSKLNNLYLVHEIPYDKIKKSEDWIDIDLKGKLGDALVVRTTLPISAFDYSVIKDASMDTYNSRLHIFNYLEEDRCGYNIEDFNLYGGYGQYNAVAEEEFETACIAVDYNNSDGKSRVVKYFDKPIVTTNGNKPILNQCISFHRGDATTITLYYKKYDSIWYSVNIYQLKKSGYGGYSLCLTKELTPTIAASNANTNELPEQYNLSTPKESMRVSDTFLPQTFQYANAYTIGNGIIVGVASLSTALSQDTFGQYPLLVFCTDGIYSMGVDTSGVGVYNNIAPFSREVCVNPNSICEIDGAVLFASSKGLMIATSQGVQEFVPELNGTPRHRPDGKEIRGAGMELYGLSVSNEQITTLIDTLDEYDFMEYVANSNTFVTYASEKNKVVVYNGEKPYIYWIDIQSRNVTKLPVSIKFDNNDYPSERYVKSNGAMMEFGQLSANVDTQTMFQTRPIKLDGGMRAAMRVIVRGYFKSNEENKWAALLVLGSYDGINWQPLGVKQKPLSGGFNDIGCVTDRVSHKYMMVILSASLSKDSHIDGIDISKVNKYMNKLK